MKRTLIITYLSLLTLLFSTLGAVAQQVYLSELSVSDAVVEKKGDLVEVSMTLDFRQMPLGSQDLVQLIPVLIQKGEGAQVVLPPIYLVGEARYRALDRQIHLGNMEDIMTGAKYMIVGEDRHKSITYREVIPYATWMEQSELSITSYVTACADCLKERCHLPIDAVMKLTPYKPSYKLLYIELAVEEVKARSDTYAATLNFRVGRYDLDPSYMNNREILSGASRVIRDVLNNPDLTVGEININGYASPEGSASSNKLLSTRRAQAFANYIAERTTGWRGKMMVVGHGEDWTGVRKLVEQSYHPDKQQVLDVIDMVYELDARDARLRSLSGGRTYRWLLGQLYPQVRRTEYTLAYVARAFDVKEAKQVIRTNPKLLSLNEMYLVSRLYEAGSKEFKEVFDIASRLYPEQPVAVNNSAAADIEMGAYESAIERLGSLKAAPYVWNNLGVAYAMQGEYDKAKKYFEKSGTAEAKYNLEELAKRMK